MAITYVGTLATDLDKVRFYLRDTADDAGPLPNGVNFTDNELSGLITTEGSWGRAVAAGFEVLASEYAVLVDATVGPRREQLSQTAKRFESLAKTWRSRHGGSPSAARVGTRSVIKVDGYSDDIASDEV